MNDKQQLEQYLSNFNNGVADNVTVVSAEELGQRWLYHISVDPKIKRFIPELSRRTALKEDRTVPRISTAPTIIGCLLGYQADLGEFLNNTLGDDWNGGWYVYGFDSQPSVLPGKKILIDVQTTDERWLVPYRSDKWQYPAKMIGKFYYRKASVYTQGKNQKWEVEVLVEVNRDAEIRFFDGLTLAEGFWNLTFDRSIHSWKKGVGEHVRQLSTSEWKKLKGVHADLLSYQEPNSSTW